VTIRIRPRETIGQSRVSSVIPVCLLIVATLRVQNGDGSNKWGIFYCGVKTGSSWIAAPEPAAAIHFRRPPQEPGYRPANAANEYRLFITRMAEPESAAMCTDVNRHDKIKRRLADE